MKHSIKKIIFLLNCLFFQAASCYIYSQNFAGGSFDGIGSAKILCGASRQISGGSFDGSNRALILCGVTHLHGGGSYDGAVRNIITCGVTHSYSGGPCSGDFSNIALCAGNIYTTKSCGSSSLLPLDLHSFKTNCDENVIHIEWITATENHTGYFSVERAMTDPALPLSINDLEWMELGHVDASGNSTGNQSYSFEDNLQLFSPQSGNIVFYYRLRLYNLSGTTETFSPHPVSFPCESWSDLFVFPNPADEIINIFAPSEMNKIELMGLSGQVLRSFEVSGHNFQMNLAEFPGGIYLVRATTAHKTWYKKISVLH